MRQKPLVRWQMIKAGEYRSYDERFGILAQPEGVWALYDYNNSEKYETASYSDCKKKAERIVKEETNQRQENKKVQEKEIAKDNTIKKEMAKDNINYSSQQDEIVRLPFTRKVLSLSL